MKPWKVAGSLVLAAGAVVALVVGGRWLLTPPPTPPDILQGEVDATQVDVASKIAARVSTVDVQVGQRIARGSRVITLDSPEARARLAQAEAARAAAQSLEDKARHGARQEEIRQAEAMWRRAADAVDYAETTFARLDRLEKSGVVPKQRRDEAEAGVKSARGAAAAARAAYDMALAGARVEDTRAAAAQVARAKGAIAEVEAALADTTLSAPIDGEIVARHVEPGELVGPGAPLVSILDTRDLWVTFHVREDRLAGVKIGDTIRARVPALSNGEMTFTVSRIAGEADYATWRSTSAQGGFDLKTFEVRATPGGDTTALRPGMSVIVTGALVAR